MTILNPSENKKRFYFIILFLAVLLGGGIFYIYQYNQLVNLRHQIDSFQSALLKAQAANTDLKNQVYEITDPAQLKIAAGKLGLILDSHPKYLNQAQWLSDSSL